MAGCHGAAVINEARSKFVCYSLYGIIYPPIELGIGAAFWDDKAYGRQDVLPMVRRG